MFGKYLTGLREQSGMTQRDLARKAGVSKALVGFLEKDLRTPSDETVVRLADALMSNVDTMREIAGLFGKEREALLALVDVEQRRFLYEEAARRGCSALDVLRAAVDAIRNMQKEESPCTDGRRR